MTELADKIIDKYYEDNPVARNYLYEHSLSVANLAIRVAKENKHLKVNMDKLINSAMLHDIGIFLTHAPGIGCNGQFPYLVHGVLGRTVLEIEQLPSIAKVCERHVGIGFTKKDIKEQKLPFPYRDMIPSSIEERIVCYADKFYSKKPNHINIPKPIVKVYQKIRSYGNEKLERFAEMVEEFGYEYIYEKPRH
jgi:uncharacterized protein